MRKEGLKNFILTGEIDGKKGRDKQRIPNLLSVSKWMAGHTGKITKRQNLLTA